jgi:hypothetical protein
MKSGKRRMRPRDLFFALAGSAALVTALAVLAFGRPQDRASSVPVLFFALALLIVALSGRLAARAGLRPQLEHVEHDGAPQPALVIPGSAVKLKLMRWASLSFAAAGLALALADGAVVIGVLTLVVFGAFAVLGGRRAGRPWRIALLPGGLRWELGGPPAYVAWDDLTRVGTFSLNRTYFLGLDTRPGAIRMPPRRRWLNRADQAISGWDASVTLEAFPVEPEQLAEVVSACAAAPERRGDIGTARSLAWFGEAPRAELTGSSSTA